MSRVVRTFTTGAIRRIQNAVKRVESTPASTLSTTNQKNTANTPFYAIITAGDLADGFSWNEIVMQADGTWTALGGTGTNNAHPLGPIAAHYGARVVMRFSGYDGDGEPLFCFVSPGHHFPVLVEMDGGDNASGPSETADYTYTVRDIYGTSVLGTEVEVVKPREPGPVTCQEGTSGNGVAFFDKMGVLKLWDAGETYQLTTDCDDGA
jgi:hypothetical protein